MRLWRKRGRKATAAAEVKESRSSALSLDVVAEEGTPAEGTPALDRSTVDPTPWEERIMSWHERQAALHAANRAALGLAEDDGNDDRSGQRASGVAPRVDGNPPGPRWVEL